MKLNTSRICISLIIFLFIIKAVVNQNEELKFMDESFFEKSYEKIMENIYDEGFGNKLKICETYGTERTLLIEHYIKENSEKLSDDDINLIKFIAGDCQPVILFPGFYANKFQFHITSCDDIRQFHPEIAKACGYDHKCEDGHEEVFWLSENFETENKGTCMGEVGKFNLKRNETESDPKKKFYEEAFKGFRVTYWGDTPQTESENECGFGASSNLLDMKYYFGVKSPRGALDFKNHFLKLGYTIGVNLFSIPFDWRRNSNHESNFHLAKQTVDLAYKLTGKQSVLVGHSYGTIIALNYLYSVTKEEKEQKVSRLIGIGPPFTGANKSIAAFILGIDEMNIKVSVLNLKIIDLYFSIQNQKKMLYNMPAVLEMLPRFFWDLHKDEEFMHVVRGRASVENRITECVRNYFKAHQSYYDYFFNFKHDKEIREGCIDKIKAESSEELKKFKEFFPFLPDLQEGCGKESVNDATCVKLPFCRSSIWDKYCRLNIFTPLDHPLVEIKDGEENISYDLLTKENIIDMIKNYGMATPDVEYLEYTFENFNSDLHELNHPGVPVTIYYADFAMTTQRFSIPDDPKKYTDQDMLVVDALGKQIVQFEGGDGTISTSNVVIPALKWSLDREQTQRNPIHLVSYCTNQDFSSSEIKFDQNQYLNLKCGCASPSTNACGHSSMISDPDIIAHITNYSTNTRNRLDDKQFSENMDLITKGINRIEKELKCSNLKIVNNILNFKE